MTNKKEPTRIQFKLRSIHCLPLITTLILLLMMAISVPRVSAQTGKCKAQIINTTANCDMPVTIILSQPPSNEKNNAPCVKCNFHVEIMHAGVTVCTMNWNPTNSSQWCGKDTSMEFKVGKKESCKEEFIDGESYHVRVTDSSRVIPGGEFDFVYHAACNLQVSAPQEIRHGSPFTFTVTGDVCNSTTSFSWQIKSRTDGSAVRTGTIQDAMQSQPISDLPLGNYFIQASTGGGCSSAEKDFIVKCEKDEEVCDNEIDDNCNGIIDEGCCHINSDINIIEQHHSEWFGHFRYKYVTFAMPAGGSKPEEWKVTLDGQEESLSRDSDRLVFSDRIRYKPPKKEKKGDENKPAAPEYLDLKLVHTCKHGTTEQTFKVGFDNKMIVMER